MRGRFAPIGVVPQSRKIFVPAVFAGAKVFLFARKHILVRGCLATGDACGGETFFRWARKKDAGIAATISRTDDAA